MVLRYHFGLGVGHVYSHKARSAQPLASSPTAMTVDVGHHIQVLGTLPTSNIGPPPPGTQASDSSHPQPISLGARHDGVPQHPEECSAHDLGSQSDSGSKSESDSSSESDFDEEEDEERDEEERLSDICDEELVAEEMYE